MLEAHHYSASAERKGMYALPQEFDGTVNQAVLYQAVRAFRNNQRQGNASTKTRAEVSGGTRKPWRQKGTGRARQGTTRSPIWAGGGIAFGPRPRSYRIELPRKVRQSARQSALNARANEGALYVIEAFEFGQPKTREMIQLLEKLELSSKKVLILTNGVRPEVFLSCRNIPTVDVMRYTDASAYSILWADALVIEEGAIGGEVVKRAKTSGSRTKRAEKAAAVKKSAKKVAKKKASKATVKKASGKKKGGDDA
ncbi:MAG: 50S ribosomal protein L4 [Gemmatimonadota bacterium]|nr:MAG: 50S ribosomal protein L4 [Gemmatimonadota bacterium]